MLAVDIRINLDLKKSYTARSTGDKRADGSVRYECRDALDTTRLPKYIYHKPTMKGGAAKLAVQVIQAYNETDNSNNGVERT